MQDFYDICLKKELTKEPSWHDIYLMFEYKYNFRSGEHARDMWRRYRKKNGLVDNKKTKVLIISDLHIPDHKEDLIMSIVKQNSNVDMIIFLGDILDCKAVSSWYDEEISILDYEMITAHKLFSTLRKMTKAKFVFVKGNHEERLNRFYAKNAKAMGTSVVETEILYKLINGFTIKSKKQNTRTIYEPIENCVYSEGRTYIIGDLLTNHPSIFKKDHMKTVNTMYTEKFKDKYPNANVIAIGHTHQLGNVFSQNGKVLIETGCMCNPMSYADNDDRPFKLQQLGYVYLELEDNKVDIDSIKLKYLGHDEVIE